MLFHIVFTIAIWMRKLGLKEITKLICHSLWVTEPKDCVLPCWTENDAFTLPCTPGCAEDSLGGFWTGCFTEPKDPSLLTCCVCRRLLACVLSQEAQAAFSTRRWQANYRLQEWSVDTLGIVWKICPEPWPGTGLPAPPSLGQWGAGRAKTVIVIM